MESKSLNLLDTQSIVMQARIEEEEGLNNRERKRISEPRSRSEETLCIGGGLGWQKEGRGW